MPDYELAQQIVKEFEDLEKQDAQQFLDAVVEHRKRIDSKGRYKKGMNTLPVRLEHLEDTKRLITTLVDGLPLDWVNLELYLKTFDEWIRQLSIQPSLMITPNDWDDLNNLVYVQPGSLYWTEDKKKTKKYIQDCGCGHYLYKN